MSKVYVYMRNISDCVFLCLNAGADKRGAGVGDSSPFDLIFLNIPKFTLAPNRKTAKLK